MGNYMTRPVGSLDKNVDQINEKINPVIWPSMYI